MTPNKAILAAGCFWGVQYYFDEVPGVIKTTVGYTGGHKDYPTYWEVVYNKTGHVEAVLIEFDPKQVSYQTLLKQFFRMHDPTQMNRQGPDVGDEYRSAIFYFDDEQKIAAQVAKKAAQKDFEQPIVTEITKATKFYPAEDEHQKFSQKTGIGMCHVPYKPV